MIGHLMNERLTDLMEDPVSRYCFED